MITTLALALSIAMQTPVQPLPPTIYSFTMKDIDGNDLPLSKFKGRVLLVVNVASKCGLTPQYDALERLYKEHAGAGLEVLGFPSNNFGEQEPGADGEIKEFCRANYGVSFPMFSKISVKGETTHSLYRWLLAMSDRHEEVEWNFAKFLVGRNGKVLNRFSPKTSPESQEVRAAIREALKAERGP